ncbi:Hcp family type VI secretion system effector [Pseudomonas syringae]|uniref:Hcp family type VI secretion system effector n=1 Tax=Pseudomonas syringae TaxID=317 RepID=UPI0018E63A76|nr:type VI secretion system tube protein Hcp [Pseudomonas syringae]MBI6753642.1 type VI secretion system tube protein Hcp [Pseudomonas syringae]MBI6769103.1 type VI secretion system tube protein Hcp [Pseudomonas syringae]MBI6778233.1 type VI secretion system tube protein Hcp [Pseudomonas syringae]MBI6790529.1 type VI secretion system tube protein Hcp [Pseudomonas syringae]MBI6800652.1 type VI secretion system tube protein Hcp [Pseudomonas syringae]
MSFEAYLQIEGIPGETLSEGYENWIELQDFDLSASQTASATATSAGGATSGRAYLSDLLVRKPVDNATPKLHEACCSGKHFKQVSVHVFRAGDPKVKYLEIVLEEVIISSFALTGNGYQSNAFPSELIALNYGRIKLIYSKQSRKTGQGAGQIAGGWDAISNKIYA